MRQLEDKMIDRENNDEDQIDYLEQVIDQIRNEIEVNHENSKEILKL